MLELLRSHYATISAFLDDISRYPEEYRRGEATTLSIYTHVLKDAQTVLLSLINYLESK